MVSHCRKDQTIVEQKPAFLNSKSLKTKLNHKKEDGGGIVFKFTIIKIEVQ